MQPVEVTMMVKVSIEVHNRAARFSVSVKAHSIEQAMSVVRGRYPGCSVRVRFPIDPEGFFVKEPTPWAGIVGVDQVDLIAA
jgi:hypothetical protein